MAVATSVDRPAQPSGGGPPVRRFMRKWEGQFWVLPFLLGFIIFFAGPFVFSFILGLGHWNIVGKYAFAGLDNYVELFTNDEVFVKAVGNTLVYSFAHVAGTTLFGLAAALLLNEKVRGVSVFRTIFYLPSITPGVATAIIWLSLLHPHGMINNVLLFFGVARDDLPTWFNSTTWAMPALIVMSLWNIGTIMIILLAGLQGIPQHMYEAASVDGANWWSRLRHVTLPMLTPSLFFVIIVGVTGAMQSFSNALVTTNGGPANTTMMVLLWLYRQAFDFHAMGYAAAIAWVLFVFIMLFTLVQFWLARRWVYYESGSVL